MAHMSPPIIFLILLSLIFASTTFALSESPFIVAHKKVTLSKFKINSERVSVSIDIYNRGSAVAYDVSLTDDNWDKDIFDVVTGNTSRSWEKLDVGSQLSHSFELESKVKGVYHGAPAIITYRIPTKTNLQVAYSTPIPALEILADTFASKKFVLKLVAKYGSHVSVILIVLLFTHIITTPKKRK